MENLVELGIDRNLMDALRDLSQQQGTSVTALINLALKEFILSMEDELEMSAMRSIVPPCPLG